MAHDSACSWAEFAKVIVDESMRSGAIESRPIISKITTQEYQTLAKRPLNSQLDSSKFQSTFGIEASDWRLGVKSSLAALNKLRNKK